jgi:hypothetical protein
MITTIQTTVAPVPEYFAEYLVKGFAAHDDDISTEWLACQYAHKRKQAWVMRLFAPLANALIDDLKFAVLHDVSDGVYVRNGIQEPPDALVEPFWNDSIGVSIRYAGYKTGLRVCGNVAMEPRMLRNSLVGLCGDFCTICNCGNMTPLTLLGTFVDTNEVMPMVRYLSNSKWPRGTEECDHVAIAHKHTCLLRCLLANIAFETEIRELGLPADCELRYDTDRAFVQILCDCMRGGPCSRVPLDVWYMIRHMVRYGYTTKKRWDVENPNAVNDWSFLQPMKMEIV